MDFGNKYIYECPNCKKLTGSYSVTSCNNFGATSYSDGYTRGMMYAEDAEIGKCPECDTIFWFDENEIGAYGPLTINKEWAEAPDPEALNGDEYSEVLKKKMYKNKDQERYLRNHMWLCFNNNMRCGPSEGKPVFTKKDEASYQSNCKKLIKLLNMDDTDDRMLIAELHRNICNFEESAEILKSIKNKNYAWMIKLLLKECKKKNRMTIELKRHGVRAGEEDDGD